MVNNFVFDHYKVVYKVVYIRVNVCLFKRMLFLTSYDPNLVVNYDPKVIRHNQVDVFNSVTSFIDQVTLILIELYVFTFVNELNQD